MKTTIIINGTGGSGKDAICEIAAKHYRVKNVSAIEGIKVAASLIGWDGGKDAESRKFLSDLQDISTAYNDFSIASMVKVYKRFMSSESDDELLFIHIRKPADIRRFKESCSKGVATLLVSHPNVGKLGNSADDEVYKYKYNYGYKNTTATLEALEDDVMQLIDGIVSEFSVEI